MGYWDQTNPELTGCKDHKIIKAPVLFQWVRGTYKSHFTLKLNNIELLLIIINGNYKDFFMTQKEDQCLADIMVLYIYIYIVLEETVVTPDFSCHFYFL